jgi:hypothetical protein
MTYPYVVTCNGVVRSFKTKWEATDHIFRLRILWGMDAALCLAPL